jgi:serine/threonine protein kinase
MESYRQFITSVLTSFTVIFIGISVDDVAVGSHLDNLKKLNLQIGSHYWITHRNDVETDRWAESMYLRRVAYRAHGNDHSELDQMLADLVSYIPPEDNLKQYPPAVLGSSLEPVSSLPPPDIVRKLDPNEIRLLLNQRANDILRPENPDKIEQFNAFVRDYGYAIHNAWYVSTESPENDLVGYKLKEKRNKGAFGEIYKAEAPGGSPVAIKLLKDEVRSDALLLQSFRRGVRAMHILSQHKVKGVVAYKEASEIPAFVAMDWIDGFDLRQAFQSHLLQSWDSVLEISLKIASVLKEAHALPERVLHRDLRPANIMVKRPRLHRPWEVYLLDFDLSWYLGSIEQSVIYGSDAFGFLAPEQIHPQNGSSSRHPAVDSYGLGMTFYFMISGQNPMPGQHLHSDWTDQVEAAAAQMRKANWASTPARFARLILNMTEHRQTARWDLAQIVLELQRMLDSEKRPSKILFADMLAEEIASRSTLLQGYIWDPDLQAATLGVHQEGIDIILGGDDSHRWLVLQVVRVRAGLDERWKVGRRMFEAGQRIAQILRGGGWSVDISLAAANRIFIRANVDVGHVAANLESTIQLLNRVGESMPKYS